MKWHKLGKVFQPNGNIPWMQSHAAVPIAEIIDEDVYRIYFSSRDKHNRAHLAYIIVDIKRPAQVLEITNHSLLSPGELGAFDDSGAMLSWIIKNNNTRFAYYIGWNLGVTVPFRNSIGLAISGDNEKPFLKYSQGPIMDRSITEPHFPANPCVLLVSRVWKMWYISCIKWEIVDGQPRHWYHIKYAESSDGINWVRNGKVCIDFKNQSEYAISRPCVIFEDGIYKMWYSYRGHSYRIGYAESNDGINWIRKDEEAGIEVSDSGWDSEMIEYPFVFDHKNDRFMLYNGNGYGKTGFGLAIMEQD